MYKTTDQHTRGLGGTIGLHEPFLYARSKPALPTRGRAVGPSHCHDTRYLKRRCHIQNADEIKAIATAAQLYGDSILIFDGICTILEDKVFRIVFFCIVRTTRFNEARRSTVG